jgi:transcriptional regulator with XRE-family HTH domain
MSESVALNRARLQAYMTQRGWNQSELARRAGLSQSTTNRLMTGRQRPGQNTIHGLLQACPGLTYSDLFELKEVSNAC